MKINIIGNQCSQGYLMQRVFQELNQDSTLFARSTVFHSYPHKYIDIGKSKKIPFERKFRRWYNWLKRPADIEFLNSIASFGRAKTRINSFHGSDIRIHKLHLKTPKNLHFVSTRDLLLHDPKAHFLPRMVDQTLFKKDVILKEQKEFFNDGYDFVVGHFPSDPRKKGSKAIAKYIQSLPKDHGLDIKYFSNFDSLIPKFQTHIPRYEMPEVISLCDVIFDQYRPDIGAIGLIGLEAIACGVPAISTLKPEFADYPDLLKNVYSIDKDIWIDWKKIPKANPSYITKYHSIQAVKEIFEELSWVK